MRSQQISGHSSEAKRLIQLLQRGEKTALTCLAVSFNVLFCSYDDSFSFISSILLSLHTTLFFASFNSHFTTFLSSTFRLTPFPSSLLFPPLSSSGPLPRDARLFQASTASGSFKVEEVANFDQSDLLQGTHTYTRTHTHNWSLPTAFYFIALYCIVF